MEKWIVNAPNGQSCTIDLGKNTSFKHGDIVSNPTLAKRFPQIFISMGDDEPVVEKATLLTEPAPITEVKQPEPVKEPVLTLEDEVLTEKTTKKSSSGSRKKK